MYRREHLLIQYLSVRLVPEALQDLQDRKESLVLQDYQDLKETM